MVFIPSRKALSDLAQDFEQFYEQIQRSLAIASRKPEKNYFRAQNRSTAPSPTGPPRWLSIALPLPEVDPLQALQMLGGFEQQHFYWEQPSAGFAVAAADPCASVQFHGPERFHRSQTFLRNCIAATIVAEPLHQPATDLPCMGPRFYCSFTFFDTVAPESKFPPATLFLPRWQVARLSQGGTSRCSFVAHVTLQRGVPDRDGCQQIWQQYQALKHPSLAPPSSSPRASQHKRQHKSQLPHHSATDRLANTAAETTFQQSVQSVLDTLGQGKLHKAVLAHSLQVTVEHPLSAYQALKSLRHQHRDCHIFSVGSGLQENSCPIFLGASPERLLRVQNRHLQTEAIAGSAPRGKTVAEDQAIATALMANPKEQHEHRLVSKFIMDALVKLGLRPNEAPQPQVLKLASIQHLQTPIACPLPDHLHPLEVLAQLHPTPAVAGVPQQLACEQIQTLETFERSLYASPIGWIDAQGNCDFCVGIRSALIEGHHAQLFAGAGIVSGSKPAQELAEVALKLRTLLAVLTSQS